MPKRTDIKSILVVGAGPIVIGQACEFDYSGTQAIKALKEEGYRIILINSNPATIMTDPELADATYIEPITPEIVAKIIEKERPDAILPTMGGQTALNTALSLEKMGVLEKFNVEMIGAKADAIDKAEDRQRFKDAMTKIGLDTPASAVAHNLTEGLLALEKVGLPAILRPSFTMGGTGGGIAYNKAEFLEILERGLDASPTTEVLIEESVLGWKEYEMEVVRDKNDNCIIICSIENLDPMGVHTGDSITIAPALTLTDKEYQIMRDASLAVLREIGVETGGSNVQFAVNPANGRMIVIEMNPRVSRSSALASKATGFPIAKVAAKLAVGYTLDEIENDITGGATPASFEPTIDYVVVKIPRFTFEKFPGAEPTLTTAMKSVGEVMAIGRTFSESLQKALRGLETGLCGLDDMNIPGLGQGDDKNAIRAAIGTPTPDRLLYVAQAMREGMINEHIHALCKIDPWFLEQLRMIVDAEAEIKLHGIPNNSKTFRMLKSMGFSDKRIAQLTGKTEADVSATRRALNVRPVYKRIDTCAAEFSAPTAYMYSSYEMPFAALPSHLRGEGGFVQSEKTDEGVLLSSPSPDLLCKSPSPLKGEGILSYADECRPSSRNKVIILGGGPNRIGQGIEFDYCCCHACYALKDHNFETIMINCNPETVSTDYDTSDRLYFEPLTAEDVLEVIYAEQQAGRLKGVIVQFGGQTPLKLAKALETAGVPMLGTSPDAIDLAEDRDRFSELVRTLGLKQPENGVATSNDQARIIAEKIGFPVVIRPSYVLGGRAMEIVHDTVQLERYMRDAVVVSGTSPVLIDKYLSDAIEVDVDCLADTEGSFVAGIMEHIEEAGIHSGDSACSLPPFSLSDELIAQIKIQTAQLAKALHVVGLMNVQFAIKDGEIYLLEVNPRASRTVPFVAKAIGVPIAKIAAQIMAGAKLADYGLTSEKLPHIAVKEAVFPFARFPGVDTILGPEMRSTGEVMGLDKDFNAAFAKSQLAASTVLPTNGTVFVSVRDHDKPRIVDTVKRLSELGFSIVATGGTLRDLEAAGVNATKINKVLEGRPHIVDAIKNGEIALVFNTTEGAKALSDSQSIRRTALLNKVPYYTTLAGAIAAAKGIEAMMNGKLDVTPLQVHHAGLASKPLMNKSLLGPNPDLHG